MKSILTSFLLWICISGYTQTGIIKGKIQDKESKVAIASATITLLQNTGNSSVTTDTNGYYRIDSVPLGRQTIQIQALGYETITIPNIEVTSGKDVVVNGVLIEAFDQLDAVVLTSTNAKVGAINKLASVSARQFGLEEVSRFSGGRSDVARLATNYAGVSASDDSRNDIVIRGNSPTGLLWRLEGVPIPSPNHFATLGTTGGPVSALNPNMLQNSDFITAAFPSEYGNALGGVFDLSLRKGNVDDHEYMLQANIFTGVEVMAEGPLGKRKGSFLVAGRYSLLSILGIGAGGTSASPNYRDLSFNLDSGNGKWGSLSLFGIIGFSDIEFLGDDINEDDLFAAEDENTFVDSRFGVLGLKHQISIGKQGYLKTILSGSISGNDFQVDRFIDKDTPQERTILYANADNTETRYTFSTLYNTKLNHRSVLRTGVVVERFEVQTLFQDRSEQGDSDADGDPDLATFRDSDEGLTLVQPYIQGQFRVAKKLTLNGGLHAQYSSLNSQFVLEPRASVQYKIANRQTLSFGYGLHHQSVPLPLLLLNENVNGIPIQTNKELDFVRSHHFVLGYDWQFAKQWRTKVEVYYQDLSKAAVSPFPSSYSSLIEGADFVFQNDRVSLVNEGTGFNQGVELTIEKFFSQGYYGLLTTSLFESKYTASDGIERNTPFNNGYVINVLGGKEFKVGKSKQNIIFVDTKFTLAGGRYYTPVDLEASQNAGFEIQQEDQAFSLQNNDYMRWDLKFGYKINSPRKKRSHQIYMDIQNVTNTENIFARRYNRLTNTVNEVNQIGFFPGFGYRFQF